MFSYIKGIILILFTIYIAMIFGSVSIIMFAFAQLVIMILSFLCLFRECRNIDVKVETPIPVSEKGQPVYLLIKLLNVNKAWISRIKVHQRYNRKKKWLHISKVENNNNESRIKLSFQDAGRHTIRIDKVKVYDMFGLYSITKRIDRQISFFIMPTIKSYVVLLGEKIRNFEGDADIYDEIRAGNDPTETFQIREYRAGDKVQSIHWKLSAKNDELYVRENSFPKACPIVILLDAADIELMASLSYSLMDAGCPHFCSFISKSQGEMIRGRVDDEESFYSMILAYMQDGVETADDEIKRLYEQKYHENNYLHWIIITDVINIDGEVCDSEEIIL